MSGEEESEDLAESPLRFTNRELSWLAFNERVLAQAEAEDLPLLERLKFCSIYASNLDEFFMVRVAGLKDQVAAGVHRPPPDGLTPLTQLRAIREVVGEQIERLEAELMHRLRPALRQAGVEIVDFDELDGTDRKAATGEFEERIFPVLTPLAVDPGHPFPYISNLSLNLAVLVQDPESGLERFARLKVPPMIDRFTTLPSGRLVPVEQIIAANLDQLFPGMEVVGAWPFRVTRNADLTLDDEEADDLLEAVELELRRRRFGRAIRLEASRQMPPDTLGMLVKELDLDSEDVFLFQSTLDYTGFSQLLDLERMDLMQPMVTGITPPELTNVESGEDFFGRIRRGNILVHHPYDSFSASTTEFVRRASRDPKVLAIKLTLYRTSGDSPIIDSLIRAAEQGKQVAALVELKARFDESANIRWARRLEEAGVHVVYGLVGLKIHCKTTLVVREEAKGLRTYCHVGTGNYNPSTAKFYEDLGFITADRQVGEDVTQLFNFLTGYGTRVDWGRLLVAPGTLRKGLDRLIKGEMKAPPGTGRIILKMNSLVDAKIIDRLYEASRAGVQIDLIIRGICCLRPGVPGLSENIRVRSIVGRYLEHSRIYFFGNGSGEGEPSFHIGSADLMPRNLDRRVETLLRIESPEVQEKVTKILDGAQADEALAWHLQPDGQYRPPPRTGVNCHDQFEKAARKRAKQTPQNLAPVFEKE